MRHLKYAVFPLAALTIGYFVFVFHAQTKRRIVEDVSATARECYKGHQDFKAWHSKVTFPYESSIPQGTWTQRVRKLHKGQSVAEALNVLGEPDFVEAGVSKQGDRFYGCSWTYQVRNPEDTVNYKRGSWVEIFFDKSDGLVVDIDAVNIEGIPNRPFPQPTQ